MADDDQQRGDLHVVHYDRAVLDALSDAFFPFPNPDRHRLLNKEMRQVGIEGVNGNGEDDRVVVTWQYPSSVFNDYILPGINVERSGFDEDGERKTPPRVGRKYRVPADNANRVERTNPYTGETVTGYDEYVQRLNPGVYELTYDVEVRARRESAAQTMSRFVRRSIRDRCEIEVYDSKGVPSRFTVFMDGGPTDASDYTDMLNRYSGYIISYRVEAEVDEWDEHSVPAATRPPRIRGGATRDQDNG